MVVDLSRSMLTFAQLLRTQYEIDASHVQANEALRAVEIVGIRDVQRVRYALRSVFCSRAEDIECFDKAFDAFFLKRDVMARYRTDRLCHPEPVEGRPSEVEANSESATAHATLSARYSPSASQTHAQPAIPAAGLAESLADAARLISALRLGRSRRWKPHLRGSRLDFRGTLRASLQTCGDPARIFTLGHPLRNPRIIILLDASGSMSGYAESLLQFCYALCKRSLRTRAFVFSTQLREITRELRGALHGEHQLRPLGEAWGGGTRLGACLLEFVRNCGGSVDADTLTIVASDGLDAGAAGDVRSAMRQIYRRSAGVVWLNPHADAHGFEPSAAAMNAALPYVSALVSAADRESLGAVVRRLRK